MKTKTEYRNFSFKFEGRGHYRVTYTSPVTYRMWSASISDMTLIYATKNADDPKRCDLDRLANCARFCAN